MRHFQDPSGVQRMRVQNIGQILRNRLDSTQGHRRVETASGHVPSGAFGQKIQSGMSQHLRLGN